MLARVTGPARAHDPPVGTGPPVSSVAVRRIVALFVLPYVLLGLWWALANPAIAAPDEDAHLVKALGMARFDIGVPGPPAADPTDLGDVRNASITRVVEIPGRLDPAGYACFIFHAEATAACQPTTPRTTEGDVAAATTLGAYPPFLYPVAGWAASLGSDPASADRLGRLVVLAASVLLLWLACAHLVRWLGPRSLVGVALLMTPMAVFCLGSLNTSAVEILGAAGMAAVVAVYARRPESLSRSGTQALVLVSGTALVLSRQLGSSPWRCSPCCSWSSAAGATCGPGCGNGGRSPGRRSSSRRCRPSPSACGSCATTTPCCSDPGFRRQLPRVPGAGDTAHPGEHRLVRLARRPAADVVNLVWFAAAVALVVTAPASSATAATGSSSSGCSWSSCWSSYVTYSRVFFRINAGLQGRHVLPIFALVPIWSGVVVAERLRPRLFAVGVRVAAVALPLVVLIGLYLNAKRYAVGLGPDSGPRWFVPAAAVVAATGLVPLARSGVAVAAASRGRVGPDHGRVGVRLRDDPVTSPISVLGRAANLETCPRRLHHR